jgi:hypothetical protein
MGPDPETVAVMVTASPNVDGLGADTTTVRRGQGLGGRQRDEFGARAKSKGLRIGSGDNRGISCGSKVR